jgi:hypothetical protein
MTQMKLIANSQDEWTVKELVETLHAKVDDLERKLDTQLKLNASIQWHLRAIVLHLTGDRAALTAFVMASEPTVVPNEDEAMPVLASCPQCDTKAYTEAGIADFFGWRTRWADGKTIVQSWCRECRSSGKHKTEPAVEPTIVQDEPSPRKKQRLPDDVREQGILGRKFLKMATAKRDERAKVLEASSGRETKESLSLLREEQDLTTKGMAELSGYDTKRAILRKTNSDK